MHNLHDPNAIHYTPEMHIKGMYQPTNPLLECYEKKDVAFATFLVEHGANPDKMAFKSQADKAKVKIWVAANIPASTTAILLAQGAINAKYTALLNSLVPKEFPEQKALYITLIAQLDSCRDSMLTLVASKNILEVQKLNSHEHVLRMFQEALPTCPICFDLFSDHFGTSSAGAEYKLGCGHSFCTQCLGKWQTTCPTCRAKI